MGSLAASVGNIGSPEDPYAPLFRKAAKRGAFFRPGGPLASAWATPLFRPRSPARFRPPGLPAL